MKIIQRVSRQTYTPQDGYNILKGGQSTIGQFYVHRKLGSCRPWKWKRDAEELIKDLSKQRFMRFFYQMYEKIGKYTYTAYALEPINDGS